MTDGELSILVTAIIGFAGTISAQLAAHMKAKQAAHELLEMREQDRLDRESKAREVAELSRRDADKQMIEIERIKAITAEKDAEVRRQIALQARLQRMQQQQAKTQRDEIITAIANNTALTEHAGKRADDAYKEANTVNQKLEKIGIDNTAEQVRKDKQQAHIVEVVTETGAKVDEVKTILTDEVKPALLGDDQKHPDRQP